MKLKWIEITNFKQYYGTSRIEFANSDEDNNGNVTVVYGSNGKGKTTIYRAFIYAFHGDKQLERDGQLSKNQKNNKEILHIGNIAALQEDGYVDVSVKVAYEMHGKYYEIKRSMTATQEGTDIEEADLLDETYLKVVDENGRTETYRDIEQVNRIAEEAISKKMRQYFLFDGEQIEEMTKSTIEQRRQVREGIKKLLGIDSLYNSIDAIEKISKYYQKKIKGEAKGEYSLALDKRDKILEEKKALEAEIELLEIELEEKEIDKEEIDKYLEDNRTVREKVRERELAEDKLKSMEKAKRKLEQSVRELGSNALFAISNNILHAAESDIEMEKNNLGESFNINYNLLKEFLNKEKCGICGTSATKGTIEYLHIENILKNINESDYREALNELNLNVAIIRNKSIDSKKLIMQLREDIGILLREIKVIRKKIAEIDKEIGNVGDEEAREREVSRERLVRKMGELDQKIRKAKQSLISKNEEYSIQNYKCEELKKLKVSQTVYEDYNEFAEKALKELEKVKKKFTEQMREQVSEVSTRIFQKLLDEDSKINFNNVIVKEDFSLDIKSFSNFDFLSNISSGQRHILSISFVLALLEISEGTGDQLKTPLFMDTPFGRISGENRDNLLEIIPQKAAQWILLVTDTEFTNAEVKALRPTRRWGKLYEIKITGPGKAIIEEGNVETFVAKR